MGVGLRIVLNHFIIVMNAKTLLKQVLVLVGLVATTLQLSANPTPSGKKIRLGFIPLTDCAPLVAAKELGLFAKYGVDVELSKEASWVMFVIKS
jgi:nitrate/nitrite transport system substrate-binding protein